MGGCNEEKSSKCGTNRKIRVQSSCKKAALRLFVLMLLVVFTVPNGRVKAETDDTVSEIEEELAVNEAPVVDSHPAGITCYNNVTVKFSFKVSGTGLKYRWQTSKDNGNTWSDSSLTGYNTDTVSVAATLSRSGYMFRCIVSDKNGNTVTSDAARLNVLETGKPVSINETNFPDDIFRNYVSENYDINHNGVLSLDEISEAKEMYLNGYGSDLTSVEGICLLNKLEYIECNDNAVKSIDMYNFPSLDVLLCWNNDLTHLELNGCSSIKTLKCYMNELTSLDISALTNIKILDCKYNSLTDLNLSSCSNLIQVSCSGNKFTSLDLSDLTKLGAVECSYSNLKNLCLRNLPNLLILFCPGCKLENLDLTECPSLELLDCSSNQISELNLSNCPELYLVDVVYNSFEYLDISKCEYLSYAVFISDRGSGGYYTPIPYKDKRGNDITVRFKLDKKVELKTMYFKPIIEKQPEDILSDIGRNVNFNVKARGDQLKYQWQTSKDGGNTWLNSKMTGYNTDTLTVSAILDRNNYKFRCLVTDSKNNSVTSDPATLKVKSSATITSHPQNVTASADSTVQFKVSANGESLKYQWQTSKNNGQTWVNSSMSGCKTNTLNVVAIADRNGYMFRCVITDKNNISVASNAATLTVTSQSELKITSQPADVTTPANATVKFIVTASGTGLKYQWQTSKDGGSTWVNSGMSGYNTNTLNVLAVAARNGYKFRCVVTDKFGKTVTSNAATLTIGASTGTKITS
ncbi:MAG: hypothetical protein IKP88_21530, partial [Lachnospiraceae bacterium]|nr:hypothetical protein [Lachnospiraceae bacterium]